MRFMVSQKNLPLIKRKLREALPDTKPSDRLQALAKALGFKTYESLLCRVLGGHVCCQYDEVPFVEYMANKNILAPTRALSRALIRSLAEPVLAKHRNLVTHGFLYQWLFYDTFKSDWGKVEENRKSFLSNSHCDELEFCLEFFQRSKKRKTINREQGSYRIKHVVENISRDFGYRKDLGNYVSNGSLILSAYIEGFEVEQIRDAPMNAFFNISQKSITQFKNREFLEEVFG